MLTIASPNTDRSLLTLAELRAAVGVTDGSKDATLIPLGAYVSASITSVTENNSVLSTDDYEIDGASGILYRTNVAGYCMPNGPYGCWPCGNTVIEYSAGYATVPDDLKYAAIKFIQAENTTGSRDPLLKRLRIEGVSEREFWVDPNRSSVIPGEVMNILVSGGYINMVVA